jgi:hypothetical protein
MKQVVGVALGVLFTLSAISIDVMSVTVLTNTVVLTVVLAILFILVNKKESFHGQR